MDVGITQTCTNADLENGICLEYSYVGRLDNIDVSIPMLEAMGLLTLWVVVCFGVAYLFKIFS